MASVARRVRRRFRGAVCRRLVHEGGVTPHYTASDQDWTNWARDNQWNGRVSGFLMLLAGFVFLYFMAAIRSVLGSAESSGRTSGLARVVFGGALTGMAGIAMASVTLAAASTNGGDVDPVVSKAVATAAGGPFLVAAKGFAAFLRAVGLLAEPYSRSAGAEAPKRQPFSGVSQLT